MSHIPRSPITPDSKLPLKLKGRHAFFCRTNQVDRQEPLSQRQVGVVKDGASGDGEVILAIHALIKMAHFPGFPWGLISKNSLALAANADKTMGPANAFKVRDALFFGIESLDNLEKGRVLVHGYLL